MATGTTGMFNIILLLLSLTLVSVRSTNVRPLTEKVKTCISLKRFKETTPFQTFTFQKLVLHLHLIT